MSSITATQPTKPSSESAHGTRNVGRKDGLFRKRSSAAARFSTPYVVRKNMVSTGAIRFRSPNQTAASAMPSVSAVPRRGVSSSPEPVPSHASRFGSAPSRASAWSTRGAPSTEPSALESVAPQTPSMIESPQTAMRVITSGSATRASAEAR